MMTAMFNNIFIKRVRLVMNDLQWQGAGTRWAQVGICLVRELCRCKYRLLRNRNRKLCRCKYQLLRNRHRELYVDVNNGCFAI